MRINARLDEASQAKLEQLEKETGLSRSEIVRRAIDAYYARIRNENAEPGRALRDAGFIGCATGPEDLSTSYKEHLRGIEGKHGDR